jgi:hypothetical protein
LDGEGQKNVRNMALLGLGATGLVAVLPKAVSMMTSLGTGAAQLAVSLGASAAAAGPIGIAVAAAVAWTAALAALFAVAYARSAELRASVAQLGAALADAFAKVKPLVLAALDGIASHFATVVRGMTIAVKFSADVFVTTWNGAIQLVVENLKQLITMMKLVAMASLNLPVFLLARQAEGRADAIIAKLKGLQLDPNAKGKPGDRLPIPTPQNFGTESAEQSFQRFQQAIYKLGEGEDPQKQAVNQLKVANGHLAAIAGKGEAKQPPPPNAAGGGAINWAV